MMICSPMKILHLGPSTKMKDIMQKKLSAQNQSISQGIGSQQHHFVPTVSIHLNEGLIS